MNPYLRTQILTASPEQLRLMLFEGAVKFARQARQALLNKQWETMYNAIVRTQKIVLELQNALDPDKAPDLCDKLSALYIYIYKRLVDAHMQRDVAALDECIRLLDFERQTWEMVLSKLNEQRQAREPLDTPHDSPPADPPPLARIGPDSLPQQNSPHAGLSSFSAQG